MVHCDVIFLLICSFQLEASKNPCFSLYFQFYLFPRTNQTDGDKIPPTEARDLGPKLLNFFSTIFSTRKVDKDQFGVITLVFVLDWAIPFSVQDRLQKQLLYELCHNHRLARASCARSPLLSWPECKER